MNWETWQDRFVDARFNAEETTEWERLLTIPGLDEDDATAIMLGRRRRGEPPQGPPRTSARATGCDTATRVREDGRR